MTKKMVVIILSIVLLFSLNHFLTQAQIESTNTVIIVDDDGNGDFRTIKRAIKSAKSGDTIQVFSGTYNENIKLNKKINLIGISRELGKGKGTGKPIINGRNKNDVIWISEDYCKFQGFHVINSGLKYKSGINITAHNVIVSDNLIENNHIGIYICSVENCQIIDNAFGYNSFGIQLIDPNCHIIKNNDFNKCGITFIGTADQIENLILENNRVNGKPIYVFNKINHTIISNLDAGQITIISCDNLIIENMTMIDTTIAIMVSDSSNIIVRNCSFSNINRGAISLHGKNCEIYDNSFTNCSFSTYLENGCENIYLHHNNFIKIWQHDMPVRSYVRKRQGFVGVKNVRFDSNYWDEWIGIKIKILRGFPKMIPGYLNFLHKRLPLPPIYLRDENPALKPY